MLSSNLQKYIDVGLSSLPKNPINGMTVPFGVAVGKIQNKEYGEFVHRQCEGFLRDEDEGAQSPNASVKRILFCVGRDIGSGVWNQEKRNGIMKELVELDGDKGARFEFLLNLMGDRDLIEQTIGSENDTTLYANDGDAIRKTYEQCYGEQVVSILRYVQQDGAFGFLSDKEMEKLVFFFRFNRFGTSCNLAAACILASYLGQMGFEFDSVTCPPDVGKLIRSFEDEALYNYIVNDDDGDAHKVLLDMLTRLGKSNPRLQTDIDGAFYDLRERFNFFGPGLVTNFLCTRAFHRAWEQNEESNVGYIRFDIQDGQEFDSVQGEFVPLEAARGADNNTQEEINIRIQSVKEKIQTKRAWYEPEPETMRSPKACRGGDRSAHMHSPQSSPESVRHDRAAVRHESYFLDDNRELGDESIEARRDGARDRPLVVESDEKESRHAMVCIAGRVDKKKERQFLLLQNSWPKMPLVEVSVNYLAAAEADLSFVTKKDRALFKKLAANDYFLEVNKAFVADCSRPAL